MPPFHPSPNAHQSTASAVNTSPFGGSVSGYVMPAQPQHAPKIRLKINKKQLLLNAAGPDALPPPAAKPAKVPKPPKVKKPPKPVKEKPVKPAKPVVEPTRKLSRVRKAVNYSENRSRSPSPKRPATIEEEMPPVLMAESSQVVTEDNSMFSETASMAPESESIEPSISEEDTVADSSAEVADDKEHPPIVLRISKVSAEHFYSLTLS